MFDRIKKVGGFVKNHKKAIALGAVAAVGGVAAAMATGYVPTPEVVQSAAQVVSTTIAEHPNESLATGSAVAGIAGFGASKKLYKGAKRVYAARKSIPKAAKSLATEVAAKVRGRSEGGEQKSQGQAKINWDKAKLFIAET